jgi:phage-related tail protein
MIQLGEGLTASIVQEANKGAVQIMQAGIGQYDKQLDKSLSAKLGKSQMGYG